MQLTPTVVRKSGSASSSSSTPLPYSTKYQYSEVLKTILDSSINIIPIEIVGCMFEYKVNAEQSSCYFVNILCTFSKKSELDIFETLYKNGLLAQRLEQYLEPKILQSQHGLYPDIGNKEFKLDINILRKTNISQKPTCTTGSKKTRYNIIYITKELHEHQYIFVRPVFFLIISGHSFEPCQFRA